MNARKIIHKMDDLNIKNHTCIDCVILDMMTRKRKHEILALIQIRLLIFFAQYKIFFKIKKIENREFSSLRDICLYYNNNVYFFKNWKNCSKWSDNIFTFFIFSYHDLSTKIFKNFDFYEKYKFGDMI